MESTVKVILVEDEALNAMFVQDALEEEGFEVECLQDAGAAEKAISEGIETVAALVTDVRLGDGLTGWELARLAREASPNLPIVYISGDSAVEHSAQGVPDSLMIQKPFVGAQVVTALATLLNAKPPEER
jgi:DNA-binding response OmpR family regulator